MGVVGPLHGVVQVYSALGQIQTHQGFCSVVEPFFGAFLSEFEGILQ